ncbi:MAG: hypothetical protein HY259_03490 [Chloroflexi bacterium]|nr:hypothetical protein [Chloroflexota bacterium]
MKKYLAAGIVIGLLAALAIGVGANAVLAQGPGPAGVTLDQMKTMHESVHGAGTWDAMAAQMEAQFGADWFNQMHGSGGVMHGGIMNGGNMMSGWNSMGGMMGGSNAPQAPK